MVPHGNRTNERQEINRQGWQDAAQERRQVGPHGQTLERIRTRPNVIRKQELDKSVPMLSRIGTCEPR